MIDDGIFMAHLDDSEKHWESVKSTHGFVKLTTVDGVYRSSWK